MSLWPEMHWSIFKWARVQAFIIAHLDGGSHSELVDLRIEQCDYPSKIPDQEQCVLSLFSRYDPIL